MSEAKDKRPSNQELQKQYDTYKSTLQQLSSKLGELESDADEHRLVLETLKKTEPERKCYRMIGSVLVEKKVGEVIPVLDTNLEGLNNVVKKMAEDYKKKDQEMQDWRKKYNVQVVQTQ